MGKCNEDEDADEANREMMNVTFIYQINDVPKV